MYLMPARKKKGKQRKKTHASLQPRCKYGRACTRKGCIYRHDESPSNDPNAQVCMAFLSNNCLFGNRCRHRHPSMEECEELKVYYAQKPCRWGKFCETENCLYFHGDNAEAGSTASGQVSAASASPERRIDPSDGGAYTKDEFLEFYGGFVEWDQAAPLGGFPSSSTMSQNARPWEQYGGNSYQAAPATTVSPDHMLAEGDKARAAALATPNVAVPLPQPACVPKLTFEQAAALFAAGAAVIRHNLGTEDVALDLSSKIKIERLCDAFPDLPPSIVENAFLAFRHSFRDCAKALHAAFPGRRAVNDEELERPVMIKSKEQPKQQPKPTSGFRVQQASKSVVLSGTGDEGGFELNAAYRRLRADAMEQARQRNRAYQRATAAYKAGNKAAAKQLSREGKACDARMRELHLQAAEQIFAQRQSVLPSDCRNFVCDLHGLHPDEAISQLSKNLVQYYAEGHRVCYIITGAGSHGGGGGAGKGHGGKLRQAVMQWLDDNEFEYQETGISGSSQAGKRGTFVVDLTSSQY